MYGGRPGALMAVRRRHRGKRKGAVRRGMEPRLRQSDVWRPGRTVLSHDVVGIWSIGSTLCLNLYQWTVSYAVYTKLGNAERHTSQQRRNGIPSPTCHRHDGRLGTRHSAASRPRNSKPILAGAVVQVTRRLSTSWAKWDGP